MKIKPLGNNALIEPIPEEKSKSGIILPDTVEEKTKDEGIIKALGDGEDLKELGIKVGDKIIFVKYGGDEVEVEGIKYRIVTPEDILAVVE